VSTALTGLNEVRRFLSSTDNSNEVRQLKDKAEAARQYAKRQLSLEAQNDATETKLRCERWLGAWLKRIPDRERGRCERDATTGQVRGATRTLPDDITASKSSRWRQAAALPEAEFESWLTRVREDGGELTSAELLRVAADYVRRSTSGLTVRFDDEDVTIAAPEVLAVAGARTIPGGDASPAPVVLAMLQLFLPSDEKSILRRQLKALQQPLRTTNDSDTIRAAIDLLYERHAAGGAL
jgi:hypothetical protein